MKVIGASILWLLGFAARAAGIQVGEPLPPLSIASKGELVTVGKGFDYVPWSSDSLPGRVEIVQYLAARLSAGDINKPFTDALSVADLPAGSHEVTTIINMSDALWGSGPFISGELRHNKKKHPEARLIADQDGAGQKTWGLEPAGSAVAVLDKSGKVVFFKEGRLSADDIRDVLALVRRLH